MFTRHRNFTWKGLLWIGSLFLRPLRGLRRYLKVALPSGVDDDGVAGERIDLRLMTNRDEVSAALRRMLADKLQIRLDKITEANSLNIDLGMDGDDAVEFFEELGERFQLSMEALSEEWERYFAREGVAFFGTDGVLTLFTARACRKRVEPMLLSRVIDAVLDGHWTSTKEVT